MKITKIELKNFQGHKDSILYPKEGLNALVGASGKGKSSIHRALTWVITNKIAGDRPNLNIHNHSIKKETKAGNTTFTDNTSVSIHLDTDYVITRIKGKDNKYTIQYPNKTIKELTANGQNVPIEVLEIFNFDYLNIADQADSYFIMFDTPGEIAKKINEIVDLSLGDKLLKGIKSKTREVNSKVKNVTEDIKTLEEQLKEYDNLDSMEKDLDILSALYNTKEELSEKIKSLKEYREVIAEIDNELESIGDVSSELESIQALSILYENLLQLRDKKTLVNSYVNDLDYLNNELKSCRNASEELKAIEELHALFNKALEVERAFRVYKEQVKTITDLTNEIKACGDDNEVKILDDLLEKAHTKDLLEKSPLVMILVSITT